MKNFVYKYVLKDGDGGTYLTQTADNIVLAWQELTIKYGENLKRVTEIKTGDVYGN